MQASLAATVVGLEVPGGSRSLDVKPYATATVATRAGASANDRRYERRDGCPYGLTQTLSADLTYNTDFAQVEADEAQVNLTRFSLFFPEKREFFLENQGMFAFGGAVTRARCAGAGDTPILFYSRRIGLIGQPGGADCRGWSRDGPGRPLQHRRPQHRDGRRAAARSPDRTSRPSASSATSCGEAVSEPSSLAATTATGRRERPAPTLGVDGTFGFFDDLAINAYWAQTRAPRPRRRHELSSAARLCGRSVWRAARASARRRQLQPGGWFLRRDDMRRSFGSVPLQPEAALPPGDPAAVVDRLGRLHREHARSSRDARADGRVRRRIPEQRSREHRLYRPYEFLPRPFTISPAVTLPVAGYDFVSGRRGAWGAASHLDESLRSSTGRSSMAAEPR